MRKLLLITSISLLSLTTFASLYIETFNNGFENGGNIADGNANPWTDSRSLSGIVGGAISEVTVRLNISGGFNGDLYAYLSYNGAVVPILNRVGVGSGNDWGYSDSGMNVIFKDSAINNIHFYQAVSGYSISDGASWKPDGRTINPTTTPSSAFDAAGMATLATLNGMDPNGIWTLAIADLSGGGGQMSVQSWGLEINSMTAVPELGNYYGAAGALLLLFFATSKHCQTRRKQ